MIFQVFTIYQVSQMGSSNSKKHTPTYYANDSSKSFMKEPFSYPVYSNFNRPFAPS